MQGHKEVEKQHLSKRLESLVIMRELQFQQMIIFSMMRENIGLMKVNLKKTI
tara:strand:+ start:535 stop:690 length:156 start_codon:yes stop_codon:yes gene_type:complete